MNSPLNDLAHRLAMLAAPYGCTITVRLLGGARGGTVELRATSRDGESKEYTRQVSLRTLAIRGTAVATDFVREARLALAGSGTPEPIVTPARLRRARR